MRERTKGTLHRTGHALRIVEERSEVVGPHFRVEERDKRGAYLRSFSTFSQLEARSWYWRAMRRGYTVREERP